MNQDEQVEVGRRILDHLMNSNAPEWTRIRNEIKSTLFWAMAKAVFLFWLIYLAVQLLAGS